MYRGAALALIVLYSIAASGQTKNEKAVVNEGTKLYRSEMASWYGTDIFTERFPEKKDKAAGYFSYAFGNTATCIFYSKDEVPKAMVTISFDSSYNVRFASVGANERELTKFELGLYTLKKNASEQIRSDTLFKYYNNASLNLVPLSDDDGKRVYVMTGPKANGVVLFGNDYLITFDNKAKPKSVTRLHKSLIPIDYTSKDGKIIISSMHTHLPGYSDYITATDICTLMLYEKFAKWQSHYVLSENFVSIWQCDKNELLVLTRKAWEKISESERLGLGTK